MLENYPDNQGQYKNSDKMTKFEAKQNLLGFFDLLLKIDMRKNPEKYKKPLESLNNNYDRYGNLRNSN